MIQRSAAVRLRELLDWYPVVTLAGPRQSGKTTLVRTTLPDKPYVSLEDPDARAFATDDPRGFLDQYPDGAVLDEVQRTPELSSWIQTRIDTDGRRGLFVLTGSQQFGLLDRVSQSLAGRVGFLHLLPFSRAELAPSQPDARLEDALWKGGYPPIYDRGVPPHVWFADYMATYVERDVRQLVNVRDLAQFHRFVQLAAGRTGQLLNLSSLAADCGINHNTAAAWISVLEASYLVVRLQPFHKNYGKRLTKAPKLYFLDPGLAAWLCGVREADQLLSGPMRGAIFETFVVSEFIKYRRNRLGGEEHAFWRDSAGHEVDLLVENGDRLTLVEVKSGRTIATDWAAGIARMRRLAGEVPGLVVYGGTDARTTSNPPIFPWHQVENAAAYAVGSRA